MAMDVQVHPQVVDDRRTVPEREQPAIAQSLRILRAAVERGRELGYPYSSQVKGSKLRELRPRRGRSAWRLLYARVDNTVWILAIAPEALEDPSGFRRAIARAEQRLESLREER
jgi:hypothetical protein